MADNYEYDNIMSLAKKAGYKKIMVMRNSWGQGNWAIVNSVTLKPDGGEVKMMLHRSTIYSSPSETHFFVT